MSIVFLMYHELELPGRKLVQSEPGYVRYVLPVDEFRQQMNWMKDSGLQGLSVTEAVAFPDKPSVCITFDDGCETDILSAAPVLAQHGFRATFYITAGFLGTPGYLSTAQARDLCSLGLEIGCHSMTHPYLSDLDDVTLRHEIADAKARIEDILGQPIYHFSCPGGRYDARALEMARRAGFRTVANSRYHANSRNTDLYQLGRVAMLRGGTLENFSATCRGQGLWPMRLKDRLRYGIQRILGNRGYDRIRTALLGRAS